MNKCVDVYSYNLQPQLISHGSERTCRRNAEMLNSTRSSISRATALSAVLPEAPAPAPLLREGPLSKLKKSNCGAAPHFRNVHWLRSAGESLRLIKGSRNRGVEVAHCSRGKPKRAAF